MTGFGVVDGTIVASTKGTVADEIFDGSVDVEDKCQ